jgi:hypothetical protein
MKEILAELPPAEFVYCPSLPWKLRKEKYRLRISRYDSLVLSLRPNPDPDGAPFEVDVIHVYVHQFGDPHAGIQ